MEEWDLVIMADKLKEKQLIMQRAHTTLTDVLDGIRDELVVIRGSWRGSASDKFHTAAFGKWEEACDVAQKTGKLIASFAVAEKAMECCEAQIQGAM